MATKAIVKLPWSAPVADRLRLRRHLLDRKRSCRGGLRSGISRVVNPAVDFRAGASRRRRLFRENLLWITRRKIELADLAENVVIVAAVAADRRRIAGRQHDRQNNQCRCEHAVARPARAEIARTYHSPAHPICCACFFVLGTVGRKAVAFRPRDCRSCRSRRCRSCPAAASRFVLSRYQSQPTPPITLSDIGPVAL